MRTKVQQTKQVRDLLYSLVNKSSVAMLRNIRAEQTQVLDLFLSSPDWDAWRSQTIDSTMRDLEKIINGPAAKPTRKSKVNTVDNVLRK